VDKPGNVDVAINAKTKEGAVKKVGGMPVRVKRIPDPVARVGKSNGGNFSAPNFKVQIAPAAVLDGFDFDAKFKIIHFDFAVMPKGSDYQGPYAVDNKNGCRFSDNANVSLIMSRLKPGDRVFIDNIKAVGPDNQPRNIGTLGFLMIN